MADPKIRSADARPEVQEFEQEVAATNRPVVFRSTGVISRDEDIDPGDFLGAESWAHHRTSIKAPRLTAEEERKAAAALRGALEAGQVRYPQLANAMLRDPSKLWLLAEIQMMLSAEENEVSYDFAADAMEGLTTTTGQRQEYEYRTAYNETQQLFWSEIGSKYEQAERDFMLMALAQLTPEGADHVAGLSLAWKDTHGLTGVTEDDVDLQAQMFLNVVAQAAKEQEHELGHEGFFGVLDHLQEQADRVVFSPLLNAGVGIVSGPEEAARRRGMSFGQQATYMMGIRPPEQAGDFGWWNFMSGSIDGYKEIVGDPLAWMASVGLATKAIKTIPTAIKATKAGRVKAAAQAILPKPLSGVPRQVRGGRFARVAYAFGSKSVDELLDQAVKKGVVGDALSLIQQGNISKFQRLFPAWRGLSDETIRVIQETVTSPEEMVEVLKSAALDDVRRSGVKLDDLTRAQHASDAALRQAAGETIEAVGDASTKITPTGAAQVLELTADELDAAMKGLGQFASDPQIIRQNLVRLLDGDDIPVTAERLEAESVLKWFKQEQQPTSGLFRGIDSPLRGTDEGSRIRMAGNATPDLNEAQRFAGETGYVYRFIDEVPAATNQLNTDTHVVLGEFVVESIDHVNKIVDVRYAGEAIEATADAAGAGRKLPGPGVVFDMDDMGSTYGQTSQRLFSDLLMDQNLPRDLRLQAAKDRLSLDAWNMKSGTAFIISEIPQQSKRIFNWDNVMKRGGSGRLATGVRRTAARITPGRVPAQINLASPRKGMDELRRLGEHFGLQQQIIDDLVFDFQNLEPGARQEWVWDVFLRRIGRETGVPAFEHELISFYKGSGIRNFSAAGVDLLVGGKRIPMLSNQMAASMPVPVEELTQVFRRARSIGTRSKRVKAIGLKGRGLVGSTRSNRARMVQRLRHQLGPKAEGINDDQLYDMAYSLVNPGADMDGRGIWAGKMLPAAGSGFGRLHSYFTKAMLVFRPIQWMWRVALLEEPIRAHMFNMPSLYTNPLQYMIRAREAHYIWNAQKWAQLNASWGQDVLKVLTKGTGEQMLERVKRLGIAGDIFGDNVPDTARGVRNGIEAFVGSAIYGRTRPNRLSPVKRVPWAVKNRARSIATAEKAMKKLDLPDAFVFHDDAREISMRLVSGYLGEAVGSTDRKLYQWAVGMVEEEAFIHGRVWGGNLFQFVEDPLARMALKRRAALLRGEIPDITGHDLINSSRWQWMAPDLRQKYPGMDDVRVAERYLDDMLTQEINHLFAPFIDELSPHELADLLDQFATTRHITANLRGQAVDWDLRSANMGGGVRQVGDFTAALRQDPTIRVPSNLPAPSLDGRFMAEDSPGVAKRISDQILQTFGEDATQTINRRPAWLHEYKRHYDRYIALDIPKEMAERLAIDNANHMVNYVMFNMEEAPYYVARLNKFLPFFGATYEVLSAWSYKMPVAVGGTWQQGVGEFARKFDRIIDGLVDIGLLDREQERDGTITLTLNLVPPTSDMRDSVELGSFLQGAGFAAVNTLDQAVSTILGLEEGLGIRSQGLRLAAGHPLNLQDYGIMSFAQTDIGFNPVTNILVTALAARIPGATGPRRAAVRAGETVAEIAEGFDIDVDELVRYNRELFVDKADFGSTELYEGLLTGEIDPVTLVMPEHSSVNIPGSSLWDAMSDAFMPFGEISSPHEFATNFIPGGVRWVFAGLGLMNQPSDAFWRGDDLTGFAGLLPMTNQAQMASQLNEAFMYLQAHDLIDGKGPFDRIMEKEERLVTLKATGQVDEANELYAELRLDTQAFLDRAQKVAAESLISRGLVGQMLPTSPGHVRLEAEKIREFWDTREYADSILAGEGEVRLKNFKSMEEYEEYQEQLAAWLVDPTGDRARAVFSANNPQLMAYLTPKTFYKNPIPDIDSFDEYQRQLESGERETSPLHITMYRARSAAIQADHYNKRIATFGNDPMESAAAALQNRGLYDELQEERDLAYKGLEMWDDMHGGVYSAWREETYQDEESWAQDQITDHLNTVRDNLQILFELEDNLDIEIDLEGVANLNSSIRGAVAEISKAITQYNEQSDRTITRNAYEEAIHRYFQEVYIPYTEGISVLYDKIPEVADSERVSLIYEQIKFLKNQMAGTEAFLEGGDTPFPNPLEYSWAGKDDEERVIKLQQWLSRPVEWMDLDQAGHILEQAPNLRDYIPSDYADFDVYRVYTLRKIEVDEMFEANEVTRSQRTKMLDHLKQELQLSLVTQGRGNEIIFSEMTPFEKLELSALLPKNLEYLGDQVRYYKQVLAQNEETPGTVNGRLITQPLLDHVEQVFFSDPSMRESIQNLGINLRDDTNLDTFINYLFFGYTGER